MHLLYCLPAPLHALALLLRPAVIAVKPTILCINFGTNLLLLAVL